ncbi:MAG: hypothetical protein HYU66_20290 [Armatimonadetes bacterium]|nr:hypothetical protein [Armatimonadota bacterium]
MLVSILTPFYARDPGSPAAQEQLALWLDGLRQQTGPAELILAGTGCARSDPWTPLLAACAGSDYPHRWRALHARLDPASGRPQSRAAALNAAAAVAEGEVLLVLHADTRLPAGALDGVRVAAAAGRRWGAFHKRYQPATPWLELQAAVLNRWYLARAERAVGTNAMWLRYELWEPLPDVRLLEDVMLSDRLRRRVGRAGLCVSRDPVTVSADKYLRTGVLRSMAVNAAVMGLYRLGVASPDVLFEELYSRDKLPRSGVGFWTALLRQVWAAAHR